MSHNNVMLDLGLDPGTEKGHNRKTSDPNRVYI